MIANLAWRIFQAAIVVGVVYFLHLSQIDAGDEPMPGAALLVGIAMAGVLTFALTRFFDLCRRLVGKAQRWDLRQ